ncbi:CHC2 zinc finger domain-containing protein [Permianibacter aggregans]|uniref:DNA primase catalytic core n=1 Tax=Permianibacter aggregans TaxID=1510150 RepID=A0A4R6UVR4_9GAMM|nr:CHC2 zinc finger domain-containing protein [Permianibacter aggregans]QGX41525.1 toprim domain-containing protein [Permianibacter aggregans]TDQ51321.1 DNA primase catalytic core [Permianibacter aggregans]
MARIPEDQIERLKTEVSLVRLVEAKGVELKKHGKDYLGRCPFHDDKTPSLVVTPESNLWHCLGACNVGGSVIDWVMKTESVSFRHAVELLRERSGMVEAAGPVIESRSKATQKKLTSPLVASDADDQTLLRRVVGFYHETLKQSPEALAYLEKRGLHSPELIDRFQLGYANRTLAYRLPDKKLKGGEIRTRLQQLGIFSDKGHEFLNGSFVVPLMDENGRVVQMYGRKLLDNLRVGTPKHLYLPGAHAGIFNAEALKATDEIIVCEALIDAMTFWVHGFRNVTTAYGINGFTDELLQAFVTHQIKRVLIAFDRDEAGDKAAAELAEKLIKNGIECYRVNFPKGMDANEYALQVKPAAKSLGLVLRKAEWMGKSSPVTARNNMDSGDEFTSLAAEVLPESASPIPESKPLNVDADVKESEAVFNFGERRYRVRGLAKNSSVELLKINLLVSQGEAFHVDTLDLYSAKARQAFIKQAGLEIGCGEDTLKSDLGKILLKLEELQEQQLKKVLEPKAAEIVIDDEDKAAALELLKSPNLLDRVLTDLKTCGVIGEDVNKLTAYLACTSRKLPKPLAILIQSSSAAGKSSLLDAVLSLMPDEERVQYSAMTGQSLFYMGETNLKHKILAIAEEAGAERASYALKLLQSDGALTMASTGKDPVSGNLVTQEYRVEGPVMIAMTTTAIDNDPELLNRCIVLTVNESREQTRAIHAQQRARRTLAGLQAQAEREHVLRLHRNAQRLLRPLAVMNPYAEQLTFIDNQTRTRRDHEKYLSLIDTMALLHQHQRPIKTTTHKGKPLEYLEVRLSDIALANRLAHEVLGRSLDELPPQTRNLLQAIHRMVEERSAALEMKRGDYRFSRREVRDYTQWGNTQLKLHIQRLEDMEYLIVHRGGRGSTLVYELAYNGEGDQGERFLPGLIDVAALGYDEKKSGPIDEKSAPSRGQVGPKSVGGRDGELAENLGDLAAESSSDDEDAESAHPACKNGVSYRNETTIAAKPN